MFCFSYGSNMSLARLRERVPSAKFVAVASLAGHKLKFHKVSNDGSGKCDAAFTDDPRDYVLGVVFEIADAEKQALDRKEGLGAGYNDKDVEVVTAEGKALRSKMYFATEVNASRKPYCWYKKHVLIGARENHLPEDYVKQIEAVDTNDDPDRDRCERELSIYR